MARSSRISARPSLPDEPDDAIAVLELRIEQLSDSVATCEKISLGSKVAIAVGAGWLGLTLLHIIPFVPVATFAALTAIIGGVVLLGSNSRTWTDLEMERGLREAERAALIDALPLQAVSDEKTTLH